MLGGEWQAGSDLKWPFQPSPPAHFWQTFRQCVRLAFCSHIASHQQASHSMELDDKLGSWFPVQRNTWFLAYRTNDTLLWRKDEDKTLSVMVKSATLGFYHFSHVTETLPTHCHPIKIQILHDALWTQKPMRMVQSSEPRLPPGLLIQDTLT